MVSAPQEKTGFSQTQKQPMEIINSVMSRTIFDENLRERSKGVLAKLLESPSNKLVHLGNTLFLVMVKEPGVVEIHTMSEETPQGLARNFVNLSNYLKNIGVKKWYSYSEDTRFKKIAEMTKLPLKIEQSTARYGEKMRPVYRYTMEF